MKKIFLLFISIFLLTGCGKVDKDSLVDTFINDVESSKSYYTLSSMELYNGDDVFEYRIEVSYLDDDYFKVYMVNKVSKHEQVILRNNDEVYVVTPSLNKSYKFVSEWPYNSSQSYILTSLVKDIEESKEVVFKEEKDGYTLKVDVMYPNNQYLEYEVLHFNKDMKLKKVIVYDNEDIASIKVDFEKIDYKPNIGKDEFNVDKLVVDNISVDENTNDKKEDSSSQETGLLEDVVYPLYVPANTYLNGKETIATENGERIILTFNGEKNFVLIEEVSNVNDEFEIIPVYGDPLMLNNTIGALSSNSLTWSVGNIDYYLASTDLSTSEITTIADSLSVANIIEEK